LQHAEGVRFEVRSTRRLAQREISLPLLLVRPYFLVVYRSINRGTYPLKFPNSVRKAAQHLAREDGVSLNQWIAAAVAEKVGFVETVAAFFRKTGREC
jgi:hypothetical protein